MKVEHSLPRYKPEGRGIDSRWRHWKFSLTFRPSLRSVGSTQSLRETSTRDISWKVKTAGELQPSQLYVPTVYKSRESETSAALTTCPGVCRDCFHRCFRKTAKKGPIASSCPFVCPHGKIRPPLNGLS